MRRFLPQPSQGLMNPSGKMAHTTTTDCTNGKEPSPPALWQDGAYLHNGPLRWQGAPSPPAASLQETCDGEHSQDPHPECFSAILTVIPTFSEVSHSSASHYPMDEQDLWWLLRHLPTKSDMLFIADRIPDNLRKEISDLASKVMATETWVSLGKALLSRRTPTCRTIKHGG